MPSVSLAIDLRFAPDKGRFFVATQDLVPGDLESEKVENDSYSPSSLFKIV